MIGNSLKIFLRNISRNKTISFINISGLVLGITSTILILEYVFYERNFDSFNHNADNIYRVVYNRYRGETLLWKTANSFFPTGNYMKTTFPEVVDYFNLSRNYNIEVSGVNAAGDKTSFFEEKTYYATASIFRILTLPFIIGTDSCLSAPNTVVLSEKAAKKYFGDEDPVGKIIIVNSRYNFTVTGVYKDIPSNSHIRSDLFFSFSTLLSRSPQLMTNWSYDYCHTYLLLAKGTDFKNFEKTAFPRMVNDKYQSILGRNSERDDYYLQPIRSIHLNSSIEYETEPPGNGRNVNMLFGFSLFFLIIAWVNYTNLITARAIERAKEIGIKKVHGTLKKTLIGQFISEAFIFNSICLAISLLLLLVLNPFFKQLTGIDSLYMILNLKFFLIAFAVFIIGVLVSSIYPAFVLSSFQPLQIIKGKYGNTCEGITFRKILVTFQLFVSISFLIGTVIIYNQVRSLIGKDPGYHYHSTLILKAPRTSDEQEVYQNKILLFRESLERIPEVNGFTFVSDIPGYEINNWFSCYRKGFDPGTNNAYFRTDIDKEFITFFGIKLLAGRDYNRDDKPEQMKLIINLKAMNRLGYMTPEEAVGQLVMNGPKQECEIIGVVDDFNYYSAKVEAVPTVFTLRDTRKQYIAVMFTETDTEIESLIKWIKPEYTNIFRGNAFEYLLLEDQMAKDLKSDRIFSFVFSIFSVLAIIISIIGIVGLLMITINQNIRELGIRKTLGAKLGDLNLLLGRQLLWQLITAICIALPVSYYGYQNWVLNHYIYRISIGWQHLVIPVLIIILIFSAVVLQLARKAYSVNPAEVLRNE